MPASGGVRAVQAAHPRPGNIDAMLRYLCSGAPDEPSGQGPIAVNVLSHNCPPEQEVPMDHISAKRRLTPVKQTGPKLTAASMHNASRACRYVRRAGAPFVPPHQGNLPLPVG